MKTKNKTRKLSVILDDYNNILNDYKLSQTDEIKEQINVLQQEATSSVEQDKKDNKEAGFIMLFFLIIFIVAGVFFFLMDKENENLRNDNNVKSQIIENYEQMNLTYKQLDSLRNQTDSLYRQILNIKSDTAGTTYISYLTRNGKIVSYHDLEVENKTLQRENNDLIDKLNLLEIKLDLVQKNYDVHFIEKENSVIIKAEQIDSALMLLPYYRDKLEYNQEKRTWIITHPQK